jgi:hypothetical protein
MSYSIPTVFISVPWLRATGSLLCMDISIAGFETGLGRSAPVETDIISFHGSVHLHLGVTSRTCAQTIAMPGRKRCSVT